MAKSGETHGLRGYRAGCRCEVCKAANAGAKRGERRRAAERRAADEAARKSGPRAVPDGATPADEWMAGFADLGDMGLDLEPFQMARTLRAALREVPGDDARTVFLKTHALTLAVWLDNPGTPNLFGSLTTALRKVLTDLDLVNRPRGASSPEDAEAAQLAAMMSRLSAGRRGAG